LLTVPSWLSACVCAETGSLAEELQASAAVFVGRVLALTIDTVTVEGMAIERTRATLKVEQHWKGAQRPTVDVWTCGDQVVACTCGVDFRLGARYLVFASGKPLGTGSCSRTREADAAEELITQLDTLSLTAKGRMPTR
jgi:hypothetical protein